ncbi:MAG: BrnA antitoxin family protein [Rhodobacteraceae bacterium]|jgi:hypothetical protein|nr:BrnA antitoxin family protein [Paracoccaceae bacterium]
MTFDPTQIGKDPAEKMTLKKRLEHRFLIDQLSQFEWDLRHAVWDGRVLPSEWNFAFNTENQPKKTRVTIRLDADVVAFFRKMGPRWQTRVNLIVRSYVKARLADLVDGPTGIEVALDSIPERPYLGKWEEILRFAETGRRD